jgi:hypothetical protein
MPLVLIALFGAAGWANAADPLVRTDKRPTAPQAREIRAALQSRAELPRLKLLQRLQRSGPEADRTEVLEAVAKSFSKRIAQPTSDAIDWQYVLLLASFQSNDATNILHECLKAGDWRLALTALRGLLDANRIDDWDAIAKVAGRTEYAQVYALRRATVAYAESNGTTPAVEFLIDTVEQQQGQLKYEAAVSLTKLTGQSFGGRAADWREWWKKTAGQFTALAKADQPEISLTKPGFAWDAEVPLFFGVPVYAYRVVFVLDRSASMASSIDSETRVERARIELERALEKLAPHAFFNVLAYNENVQRFQNQLVLATPENKREAIKFAHGLQPELLTDCHEALLTGLAVDSNLEAMYFLSDGEPTTGSLIEPMSIVAAVTNVNRHQMTAIYALGIDARGPHEKFLRRLAALNNGEFFQIR